MVRSTNQPTICLLTISFDSDLFVSTSCCLVSMELLSFVFSKYTRSQENQSISHLYSKIFMHRDNMDLCSSEHSHPKL